MEWLAAHWGWILLYALFATVHIYRGYDEDIADRRRQRFNERKKRLAKTVKKVKNNLTNQT